MKVVGRRAPAWLIVAAVAAWLVAPAGAWAQCRCTSEGCYDVGQCGDPPVYNDPDGFESWCRCNGGYTGWRDCTAADQADDPSGASCVKVFTCLGLPTSCGDSGDSSSSNEAPPQEYVPPAHAAEMDKASSLYNSLKQNSQPPVIPVYTAPGTAAAPAAPAAAVVAPVVATKVRRLASRVPPLPDPSRMNTGPALDPDQPAFQLPVPSKEVQKLLERILGKAKATPADIGDEIMSQSPLGDYYQIIKTTMWARDKAIEAMDKFLDLARRGFPEQETRDFVDHQEMRYALEFYAPSIPLPEEDQ